MAGKWEETSQSGSALVHSLQHSSALLRPVTQIPVVHKPKISLFERSVASEHLGITNIWFTAHVYIKFSRVNIYGVLFLSLLPVYEQ